MDRKQLSRVEIKNADKGEFSAVFSTFDVVDSDGDVTSADAFSEGQEVLVSSYQHTSWGGALPVGTGRIRSTKSEAIVDGRFFLDTAAGRDTFTVVKELGGRQQWSYGYDIVDSERGTFAGRDVQFLKRLKVHEVSPVLIGAGVNTRTLAVKSLRDSGLSPEEAARIVSATEYAAAIRPHETRVTTKRWDGPAVVADLPADSTVDDLRAVHAHVVAAGDPTVKASYRFLHHHGPGSEANLRACLAAIAELNGAKGDPRLSEAERKAAYDHLALHLSDGDREPPELRSGADGALKFHEEAAAVLTQLDGLIARTSDVMALRRSKGKALAASSVDILEWIHDGSKRLRGLLDSPQEDADREFARFVASTLRTPGE